MRLRCTLATAAVLLPVHLGCAGPPEVYVDRNCDFGRYRTWTWSAVSARTIEAPAPYAVGADRDLASIVEHELAGRGFERTPDGGELRIGAILKVRREVAVVREVGPRESLASLHTSPSYEVQTVVERRTTYERYHLVIYAVDPRLDRIVWKGAVEERFLGAASPRIELLVARLLARFPRAGSEITATRAWGRTEATAMPSSGARPTGVHRRVAREPTALRVPARSRHGRMLPERSGSMATEAARLPS